METIAITTAQKVTIDYELAKLSERIFAYILDFVILVICGLIAVQIGLLFVNETYAQALFAFPVVSFYTLISESLMDGQTLGKKAMGLKVVKLNGYEPAFSDYLLRWSFRLLDIIFTAGSLACLLISSSAKNQRLGGMLSGTTVIRKSSKREFFLNDILKINSIDTYEPLYPDVVQFSEQDMLFIKMVIERQRKYKNPAHSKALNELVAKLCSKLGILSTPKNKVEFLKTLISDYIVLTR